MDKIIKQQKKEWVTPTLNSEIIKEATKANATNSNSGNDGGSFPNQYSS